MSKLPPVEKLSLAVRKNLRDEWDNKRGDFEEQLSQIMGDSWTISIDPKQVYAYADGGYAQDSLGSCIAGYVDGAIYRLKDFNEKFPESGIKDLNAACSAKTLTLDVDDASRFSYCGADVHEGQLRILFSPKYLGSNISDALDIDVLKKVVAEATAGESLDFAARTSIAKGYEPKVEEIREKIGKILNNTSIKLIPNFEATYAKLLEDSKKSGTELRSDWQSTLGPFILSYWEGLASQLEWQKFGSDDLMQEGFSEAVDKGEIAFRIVDQLKTGTYGEAVVEDGTLYLQCIPKYWGTNTPYIAEKLIDLL